MFVHTQQIDNLRDDPGNRFQFIFRHQIRLHINPDHDLRPESPGHVCREIIHDSPIDQYLISLFNRGKNTGNSHTRPHGLYQIPVFQNNLFPLKHICRHASKGNGQFHKIQGIMIPDREVGKQVIHVLPADKPYRTTLSKRHGKQVLGILIFFPERQIITIHFITQKKHPILITHQTIQLIGRVTDSIQAPHDRPHTGTHNHINRDTRFLQHLQHANMHHPFCPSSTQHQPDLLSLRLDLRQQQ